MLKSILQWICPAQECVGQVDHPLLMYRPPSHKFNLPSDTGRKIAFLYFNGTYSPPHRGHVDTMVQAKDKLTSLGYHVIGYFSPCTNWYCKHKLGRGYIDITHRMRLLEMYCERYDWLMVEPYEALNGEYLCDPHHCYASLLGQLQKMHELEGRTWKLFWLQGIDTARIQHCDQVIVCNREGYSVKLERLLERRIEGDYELYIVNDPNTHSNISSTLIREPTVSLNQLYEGEDIKVADYIVEHDLLRLQNSTFVKNDQILDIQWSNSYICEVLSICGDQLGVPTSNIEVKNFVQTKLYGGFQGKLARVSDCTIQVNEEVILVPSFVMKLSLGKGRRYEVPETVFYRYVGRYLDGIIGIPKLYRCVEGSDSKFMLIMEDLSDCKFFEYDGETVPMGHCIQFVKKLAHIHALYWEMSGVEEGGPADIVSSLPKMGDKPYRKFLVEHFKYLWSFFGEVAKNKMSSEFFKFCSEFKTTIPETIEKLSAVSCLVHGDIWIRNLCFRGDGDNVKPYLFDWQSVCMGNGLFDLAGFCDTAKVSGTANEMVLFNIYYNYLTVYGVCSSTYPKTKLLDMYKMSKRLAFMFHSPVLLPNLAEGETGSAEYRHDLGHR